MRKTLAILAVLLAGSLSWGQVNWESYRQLGHVNDYGQVLSAKETAGLERLLVELQNQYNVELGLLTLPSAGQESLPSVAKEFYRQWGMGRDTTNKSALLLVDAKNGAMHLYVGMGLRGVLTRKWTEGLGVQMEPLAESKKLNEACVFGITTLVKRVAGHAGSLPRSGGQIVESAAPFVSPLTAHVGGLPIAGILAVAFGGLLIFSTVLRAGKQTSAYEWGSGFERERTGAFGAKKPFGNPEEKPKRFL